ncbi:MAG: repeat-containing protein [Gemmataceae bacterium]|nr:repeat-containing protein [Gemmataceae bacterium]
MGPPSLLFQEGARRHQAGDLAGAESHYLQLLALDPSHADGWANLGAIRSAQGRPADAVECYRQALRARPDHPAATFNLGAALLRIDRPAEALACFEAARPLAPPTDQLPAQTGYALLALGRAAEAAACLEAYLLSCPTDPRAWHQLGLALGHLGRDADATAAFTRSVEFAPTSGEARVSLGAAIQAAGRPDEAVACFREALRLKPGLPEAQNNLGNTYVEAGRTAEAVELLRAAVAGRPAWPALHSNLLLALNYRPGVTGPAARAEHTAWAARHADPLTPSGPPLTNDPDPARRLRVGYLSADFRRHPVAAYIGPVLAAHDRTAVRVICYSATRRPDEVTDRLRATTDAWRDISALPDPVAADLIRRDGIDVLVDLGGHTAGNRLLVLARRAAPVQVTHFGYPNTTGMKAVDYRLTDALADPPGSDEFYTERLIRLPGGAWCWGPPAGAPGLGPPPCLSNGYVTFASLNNPAKATEEVAAAWARILARVPSSQLLLLTGLLAETRDRYAEVFAGLGIDPRRLRLEPRQAADRYYALWASADIGLDPFPYNGGVTTPDALWMGVPVVALAGDSYRARQGLCVLRAVGLGDWVAESIDGYVELAVRKAADPAALRELRAGLRSRVQQSPLTDAPGFARHLEAAYRQMWADRLRQPVRV